MRYRVTQILWKAISVAIAAALTAAAAIIASVQPSASSNDLTEERAEMSATHGGSSLNCNSDETETLC